jgi:hypothetical protein
VSDRAVRAVLALTILALSVFYVRAGSTRARTGGRPMRSPSLAVMAVSASLVCAACATGAGPAPSPAAPSPSTHAQAPGGAVPPAAHIG